LAEPAKAMLAGMETGGRDSGHGRTNRLCTD